MRAILILSLFTAVGFAADNSADLVPAKMIWDKATRNMFADIVRVKDRWYVACVESTGSYAQDGAVRVLTSTDGETWSAMARLASPTPKKGLCCPRFTLPPDGPLTLTAHGIVPTPGVPEPVPQYGGTTQTFAWQLGEAGDWNRLDPIGENNYNTSRVVWHKKKAYCYGHGLICGIAQTIQIYESDTGKSFKSVYEQTNSGFFPGDGAMIFDGDTAYCLMATTSNAVTSDTPARLGSAKPPYKDWDWKELDARYSAPTLHRLPDNRVVASLGISDKGARTAVGEFDLKTGQFTEWATLPTDGAAVPAGFALHDGHLWTAFHAAGKNKPSVHLAKVKVK